MVSAAFHGIVLALGLILPLGVQNVFVFNQGANQPKFSRTLPVIITAAFCDTLLILLAVLGVSVIVFGVYWIKQAILLIGMIFLIYMGFITWRSVPDGKSPHGNSNSLGLGKQIAFAASVSLLNPHAIMDTIGVIGTSSLAYEGLEKVSFTLACIAVSWIWFFSLAFVGGQVGKHDYSTKFIVYLNKISALIIWGVTIYLIMMFFKNTV